MTLKMERVRKYLKQLIAAAVLSAVTALSIAGFIALSGLQQEADVVFEEPAESVEPAGPVAITDDELNQLISGDLSLDSLAQGAGEVTFESEAPAASDEADSSALQEKPVSPAQSAASSKAASEPAAESSSVSSSQKTQPSSSASASQKTASEPQGYEAELKALIQQVYAVKARAERGLNASITSAKAEYKALPKNQQTQARKLMIVFSKTAELNTLQSSCDREMESIVSRMRTLLQENGQSTALADQVMETYNAEKSKRYTELKNKLYS